MAILGQSFPGLTDCHFASMIEVKFKGLPWPQNEDIILRWKFVDNLQLDIATNNYNAVLAYFIEESLQICPKNEAIKLKSFRQLTIRGIAHGSALEGSDPHELPPGFEACQMKGTHL